MNEGLPKAAQPEKAREAGALKATRDYLDALRAARPETYDQEKIAACVEELADYTDEQLMQLVGEGAQALWNDRSEWYYALIETIDGRELSD